MFVVIDLGGALQLAYGEAICALPVFKILERRHQILAHPATEKIDGTVAVFGLGVQAGMRLSEKQKASQTMWAVIVKALIHNR
jgi:hypothetical protein